MGNALFIVWRESAEAMLVVGLLYAWLKRQPDARTGMRYLWGGVAAGVGLALLLAALMLGIASFLSGEAMDWFQVGMMLAAAALIVQMVFWMRRHGRHLKRDLEGRMQRSLEQANWWGMLAVVALAVARESAETVVFLYGVGIEPGSAGRFAGVVVLGIALAFATFWLLQAGGKVMSWRAFFRVSEVLLLLLAGALFVGAVERMIGMDVIPAGPELWDTTWLLDDSGRIGGFLASFTGYRARPTLVMLVALAGFWTAIALLLRNRPGSSSTSAIPARG
jgi:high-affinity iron transporter